MDKNSTEKVTSYTGLRMPVELKERLQRLADESNRTLSQQIVYMLGENLKTYAGIG